MHKIVFFLNFALLGFTHSVNAQDLIQFSGVVVDADSLKPIPFSNVIIQNTNRGTSSDFFGFYSFVAQPGDSIIFSSLGYQSALFIIPDTLSTKRYSIIQVLNKNIINLEEIPIYPWPTREEFKQAFMNLRIPNDDYQRALYNLDRSRMKEKFEGLEMDATANYKYTMNQYQTRLYGAGQYPVNNLLNPIAWTRFIQEWKKGTYKKKKKP